MSDHEDVKTFKKFINFDDMNQLVKLCIKRLTLATMMNQLTSKN